MRSRWRRPHRVSADAPGGDCRDTALAERLVATLACELHAWQRFPDARAARSRFSTRADGSPGDTDGTPCSTIDRDRPTKEVDNRRLRGVVFRGSPKRGNSGTPELRLRPLCGACYTDTASMIPDDTDRTALWLTVIDTLIRESRSPRAASLAELVRLLTNIQFALKRWPWEERSRRGATPSRWLIDDEADVQALLWAVLAPVYGADLIDETYLPHWGQVQPRCDLGVLSLRTIIEVKIARTPADFALIEERVAGDAGIYFCEPARFERMVAFVYDDCDRARPERYAGLANALERRERVAAVIIVRRPGMIPDRNART